MARLPLPLLTWLESAPPSLLLSLFGSALAAGGLLLYLRRATRAGAPKAAQAAEKPEHLELRYFAIEGKAAPIRHLLRHMNVDFVDHRYANREEFLETDKKTAKFGQVPLLRARVGGKQVDLVQTSSIMRYLARAYNRTDLYPEGVLAELVDALLDFEVDLSLGETAIRYNERHGVVLTDESRASSQRAYVKVIKDAKGKLSYLEKALADGGTGWVAGTPSPTIADFVWGNRLRYTMKMIGEWGGHGELVETKRRFPSVSKFVVAFAELPAVRYWDRFASK